jgi:hypothetical protein
MSLNEGEARKEGRRKGRRKEPAERRRRKMGRMKDKNMEYTSCS